MLFWLPSKLLSWLLLQAAALSSPISCCSGCPSKLLLQAVVLSSPASCYFGLFWLPQQVAVSASPAGCCHGFSSRLLSWLLQQAVVLSFHSKLLFCPCGEYSGDFLVLTPCFKLPITGWKLAQICSNGLPNVAHRPSLLLPELAKFCVVCLSLVGLPRTPIYLAHPQAGAFPVGLQIRPKQSLPCSRQ